MGSPPPSRRVLLVEPWLAGSHRAWADGVSKHSRHDIRLLAETPRSWRDTFDHAAARLASRVANGDTDVVIVSSMMDLAAFLKLAALEATPTILYMHENQLTYDRARPDRARGAVNWASVRTARRVVFNSSFHRDDFHAALAILDADQNEVERSHATAVVLPVGIELDAPPRPSASFGPPTIAWNHRWEADKDPGTFIRALIANGDLPFRLILLGGGSGRDRYTAELSRRFPDRVAYSGHADRAGYVAQLATADVVVSTARQEFFGVSIAEAMAAGAVPLVPDALAYPELLGPGLAGCRYPPGELDDALRTLLTVPGEIERRRPQAVRAGRRFGWETVVGSYDELIDSTT